MPWKVDGYCNKVSQVKKAGGAPSDKFFATEYEALRFLFDRSFEAIARLDDEAENARLRHNKMAQKFGARLRELRAGSSSPTESQR